MQTTVLIVQLDWTHWQKSSAFRQTKSVHSLIVPNYGMWYTADWTQHKTHVTQALIGSQPCLDEAM